MLYDLLDIFTEGNQGTFNMSAIEYARKHNQRNKNQKRMRGSKK
jgi:hypothetical protein